MEEKDISTTTNETKRGAVNESAPAAFSSVASNFDPVFVQGSSFASQVDAVLSGADTSSTHIKVMDTPLILRQLGTRSLPVLITAKHLKSITQESGSDSMNYHGLDIDLVKRLPELLADPVMAMDSLTRDDSVVLLTSTVDRQNRPVIAAIKFDGVGRQDSQVIEANILTSSYGKDNFQDFLERNIEKKTILYCSKEKSQEMSVNLGIQFSNVVANLSFNTIIRKAKAFVNSSAQENVGEQTKSTEKEESELDSVIDKYG